MTKKRLLRFGNYLVTVVVSIVLSFSVCFYVELELLFKTQEKVNNEELNTENLAKFCTIEQLEQCIKNEPDNYFAQIKIAQIYESLNEYDKAKEYFEDALRTSGRSNYSLYSYALFCARCSDYFSAASFAEEIRGFNKKTIEYRAKIYESIADNLFARGEFEASVKAYQIAYKYSKNLKDKKYNANIKAKYSNAFVKLADYHMENNDVASAILDLKNSLKIKDNNLTKYKLALVYKDIDLKYSEKYFSQVFKKNPYMVNPQIYNSVLSELINDFKSKGRYGSADYYLMKKTGLINNIKNLYVFKNDILIDNAKIIREAFFLSKKKHNFLSFSIRNNTDQKIGNLFIKIELYVNGEKCVLEDKIVTKASAIGEYDVLENAKMLIPDNIKINKMQKNDIIAKYYAKKRDDAPWTLIKIDMMNF